MSNNDLVAIFRNGVGIGALALFLGACATPAPTINTGPDAKMSFDGLYEVQNTRADAAWARADLDLSGYTKIKFQNVEIEYRLGGRSSRLSASRSMGGPYEVTEDQKVRLQKLVNETMIDELGKSQKFALVDEVGPDVLLVRTALLDVVSYVPPDPVGARSEVFLRSLGEATLVLEMRDSVTDAILVRAAVRDAVDDPARMMNSNRVNNSAEIRNFIRRWTSRLRERLDSFSGYTNPTS